MSTPKKPKEKINTDKRLLKPLPVKPSSPLPEELLVDDTSLEHLLNLLNSWLIHLNVPTKLWLQVLYSISIDLLEKSLKADISSTKDSKSIYLQTISTNTPVESKFLNNVYHGILIHDDEYSISFPVGGTIRLYGVHDENNTKNLIKIVKSLIYLLNSLYLEIYVMRDSHVKLIRADSSTIKQNVLQQSITKVKPFSNHQSNQEKGVSSLFGWLKKWSPNYNTSIVTGIELNGSDEGRISSAVTNSKSSKIPSPIDTQTQQGDPHHFFKLKKRIENALISSSPNCHFPYPILLNRLEAEEDMLLEQKRLFTLSLNEHGIIRTPTADVIPPFNPKRKPSLISSISQSFKQSSSNSILLEPLDPSIQLPQSITAYYTIRNQGLLADGKNGLEHLLLDTTSIDSFNEHQSITLGFTCYPIGCPDLPCLGPIMSKIDYFRYTSPKNTTTVFPRIDQSLGDTIRHWYGQSQSSCRLHIEEQARLIPNFMAEIPTSAIYPSKELNNIEINKPDTLAPERTIYTKSSESSIRTLSTPFQTPKITRHCDHFHGCNQLLLDHVFSFTQGIGRVNVYTNTESACSLESKDKITSWIACSTCDATTAPIVLSEKAASYSFAKFMELLFYSDKFSSPKPFCSHTRSKINTKAVLVRCFSYNGITFKFMYEGEIYYDLRLPRLQMSQESTQKECISFSAPRLSLYTLNEWKHKSADRDVDLFFQTIRAHLDLLNHYVIAEHKRKARTIEPHSEATKQLQSESNRFDSEIRLLSQRLDRDHAVMLDALADSQVNELNDFRRYFAIQSDTILDYLTAWQRENCSELTDLCAWNRPDYIDSKKIHCFPGSSVLVREDEPVSIIAYTLSSNDYYHELLNEEDVNRNEKDTEGHKIAFAPSLYFSDGIVTESTKSIQSNITVIPNKPAQASVPSPTNIVDGYYSSIERKYISPSTGATSETASFRTMITEVVKSSVAEVSLNNSKRLEDLKASLSSWTKKQEEMKLENAKGDLKRRLIERTLKPLNAVQLQEETKEFKLSSYFYESIKNSPNTKPNVSPHIKHKFVHGGVEFTCIVYYAKEFELIRRRCGINQLMIQSLSRCQTWTATGGKSKSTFYKTQDDRFIVKEMVNAWNMAEKDSFLKFAPKYFEHIKKSADVPSLLAKVFGFFTIRIKNVADKKSILNLDALVMEHLFFNQKVIKRFDFKGIQDRHVDEFRKHQNDTTLWDGDWLSEYRTKMPVYEQSKAIMELAIENDTQFLSKCNIMDYSLLVGVDQNKHEMTIGIVDFIGAYTWYKKIESRSKSTLKPNKEVTVLPPEQYKIRFCREVCDYFIPIPGKFDLVEQSKTLPSLLI